MMENKFMKLGALFVALAFAVVNSYASECARVSSTPMTDADAQIYAKRLIPAPKSAQFKAGEFFRIADNCKINIAIAKCDSQKSDLKWLQKTTEKYWDCEADIAISIDPKLSSMDEEAYEIEVSPTCVSISSLDMRGVRHALKTLRQLSESERGAKDFEAYVIPQLKISDAPFMKFRGMHLVYFPETTPVEFERCIRLASYYKMNYVVVEFWGNYPFKKYPEFSWKDKTLSKSEIKRIAALAEELGVALVPQFNMLGHASGSREISLKHCALDYDKSLQNYFEPEGWSWCLSNPDTIKMLEDMMIEMHDTFGRPPFFHIGFDESYEVGTCSRCRNTATAADLIKKHIFNLHSIMQKRGARLIMWHDMLLDREDPRWKDCNVCGRAEQNLSNLHNEIPKDIVIADWQYDYPEKNGKEPEWKTSKYFKSKGFDVVVCPWRNNKGIISLGKLAKEEQLFGMLATTWGFVHGMKLQYIYSQVAAAEWGAPAMELDRKDRMSFIQHLRQMGWDMGIDSYEDAGGSLRQNHDML